MTSNQTEAGDDTADELDGDAEATSAGPQDDGGTPEAGRDEDAAGSGSAGLESDDLASDEDPDTEDHDTEDHDTEGHDDEDPDTEDHDEDEDEDAEGPSRLVLLVGAAVAFVAIAIVGVLIASSGDSGGGGGSGNNDQAASDARTDVGIFGTTDDFDRANSTTSLGDFAPGRPWTATAGTWGIRNNQAYVVRGGEFRNHAVIGIGQGDGNAQVRLDKVVNGAGLTFRYVGPYNYWAVVAVPDVATWNVIKVVDGDQEVVGNTGQSPTADGTTVAVRMHGDTIDVIINGRVRKTVVDDFQAEAGKVGITARGPDSGDARFDDFVAGLPGGIPLNAGGGGNGSNGRNGGSTTTSAPVATTGAP